MVYEVEFKFEATDIQKVEQYLKDAEFLKKSHGEDIYFDNAEAKLFKEGVFIRVRDNSRIDFKFNKNKVDLSHTGCTETSFKLPLEQDKIGSFNALLSSLNLKAVEEMTFENFLENNNLKEFVPIKKLRSAFAKDGLRFCLDCVEGLGYYLEVDKTTEDETEIPKIKQQMEQLRTNFDLKLVSTGYVELYLRKHNFDLYKKGLYLLDEDR